MSDFVADSSLILTWLLEDESHAESDALLDSLMKGAYAHAPVLLRYEVANGLLVAYARKKRISRDAWLSGMKDFESLPIRYDTDSPRLATAEISVLAEKHALTIYDAAYICCALRAKLPLATFDQQMRVAASAEGVALLA